MPDAPWIADLKSLLDAGWKGVQPLYIGWHVRSWAMELTSVRPLTMKGRRWAQPRFYRDPDCSCQSCTLGYPHEWSEGLMQSVIIGFGELEM